MTTQIEFDVEFLFREAEDQLTLARAVRFKSIADRLTNLSTDNERLRALINTPELIDFPKAVQLEAAHQRLRWGVVGDPGKTPGDWFWLIGYLAGKALHSLAADNQEKGLHHIVTTAAACANWHSAVLGKTDMRPGIETPAFEKAQDAQVTPDIKAAQAALEEWFCEELGLDMEASESDAVIQRIITAALPQKGSPL